MQSKTQTSRRILFSKDTACQQESQTVGLVGRPHVYGIRPDAVNFKPAVQAVFAKRVAVCLILKAEGDMGE